MTDHVTSAPLALFIAGQWRSGEGRDVHRVIDPSTGMASAELPMASASDLDEALAATDRGFRIWRQTAPDARGVILTRAATLLRDRVNRIAARITSEQGKPLAEGKAEVLAGAALLDFHAAEGLRVYGRVLMRPPGTRSLVLHQPVGPVAAFCAWNFPAVNVVRKLAPALAAGCSIILKPSEETPGAAVEIFQCLVDAGLPGEVAQLVFGRPDEVSRTLLASPITRKVSFTGSVSVGKHLARLAADTMMRVTMELGGHAPVLVFDDCDVDRALDLLVASKIRNAGQVCVSPTRFHVQEGIYERFARGFAERTRSVAVGSGLDTANAMGPLANSRRPDAIDSLIADARDAGARVLTGGHRKAGKGFFFEPTVLSDVPLQCRAMNEEPFGPVALIRPFRTDNEAVEEANRLPYGLAAYCFTENGRRQNMLGDAIEAGMITINQTRLAWPDSPFGGVKDSGYGSEDGPEGIAAHLVTKTLHTV